METRCIPGYSAQAELSKLKRNFKERNSYNFWNISHLVKMVIGIS